METSNRDQHGPRINEMIRTPQVRVVGEDGEQIGIMSVSDALARARKVNLDLVEVAADAKPPVCRIINYGKFKYEQKKRSLKKQSSAPLLKELRLRPNTGEHDIQVKLNKAKEILGKRDKVLITIVFRGREMAYITEGSKLAEDIITRLDEIAKVEAPPKQMGKKLVFTLGPK
ncbi:MAG: translation initiation factor IF-3 [Planctomycetia bacterium]|nr:translation initiation factor IF-3 [Planctomycetia bacterium]